MKRGTHRTLQMDTRVRQADLKETWSRYKKAGDEKARERLVRDSPLVKFVAGRMSSGLPAHIEEAT